MFSNAFVTDMLTGIDGALTTVELSLEAKEQG
jgi:hypothetical protein